MNSHLADWQRFYGMPKRDFPCFHVGTGFYDVGYYLILLQVVGHSAIRQ